MPSPAEQLLGLELSAGWAVIERAPISPGRTGGHFSQGYIVESRSGQRAFLKALDFSKAMTEADPARALQPLIDAFNFERDVLNRCKGLDRVVRALADGSVQVADYPVQYLIFELANGDVRSQADLSKRFDLAWSLRALHHVATGLNQLHTNGIAHQDLKPSNVLVFENKVAKLADLGRAAYQGHTPPHEDLEVAGDRLYAPPELLYHHIDPNWNRRRLGCDAYLLGSMIIFFFSGVGLTARFCAKLRDAHRWESWAETYIEVLPYIRDAIDAVVEDFKSEVDAGVRGDLVRTVRELCDPDPLLRGHPLNRHSAAAQFSLERYVSLFNLLARRAELGLISP